MGNLVASQDVSKELVAVHQRIDRQDVILEKVSNSFDELIRLQERQISLAEKVTEVRSEMKEMKAEVKRNHDKLGNIVGIAVGISLSISTVLAVFTWLVPLIRSSAVSALS